MLKLKVSILSLFVGLMTLAVSAQEVYFDVKVPEQVEQGKNFTVTLCIVNSDVQVSQAPELKGCVLLYGPSIGTTISTQNNGLTQTLTYNYAFTYTAEKVGIVTIEPISILVNGKEYSSPRRTITIISSEHPTQQQGAGNSSAAQSSSASPNDLIVRVSLSKGHISENETVIATIKVYTKHNIVAFKSITLPSFNGFSCKELPVPNQEVKTEQFSGEDYYTMVFKRFLLTPYKTGVLSITPGRYEATLETYETISTGFVNTYRPIQQHITTVSNSLNVIIDALPNQGRWISPNNAER